MNKQDRTHVDEMPALFERLLNAKRFPMKPRSDWKQMRAIYIIWIDGKAVHVGRTRNLQGRVRGHVSNSHYSASFAFKQARRTLSIAASYTPENSRSALFAREDFYAEFGIGSTFPQVVMNDTEHLGGCTDTVKYLKEQNLV